MRFPRFTTLLLVMNIGLIAAVGYLVAKLVEISKQPPKVIVKETKPVTIEKPKLVTVVKTNEFQWRQIESEDYRTYINRLREIGCPEETIRDLIIADVDKLLAPQLHAASPKRKDVKYWQPEEKELWNPLDDLAADEQKQSIDFQKRDILKELVGIDLVAERLKVQGQDDVYGKRLSFLPEEKRMEVRKLIDKYTRAEVAIREQMWQEGETPEDAAKLRQLQKEQQSLVARVLTPEEYKQYELWMSPTAYQVRDSFFGMDPKEGEFLAVFNLKKSFDETWHPEEITDEGSKQKLAEAQQQLEQRIQQELGAKRYADYVRAQDQDFRQLAAATSRNQVPAAKAAEVYEIKKVVLSQRNQILADPNLTAEQKQTAIQAVTTETQRAVYQTLGEKAFNHFMRHSAAEWLR